MIEVPAFVWGAFLALCLASLLYTALVLQRMLSLRLPKPACEGALPSITVLKPLCDLEPELEANLATFCEQDYPRYRVVCTAKDPSDPALEVARRVQASHPECDVRIVSGGGPALMNPKIENVSAAMAEASGEIVVVADSDVSVEPSYLRGIAAPFFDSRTGAVTVIYGARSIGTFASRLGAMFVNEQFIPSVLAARLFEPVRYTFGASMAVRRTVLEEIGGIEAIGGTIADDYTLGLLVSARGYRVALAGTIPQTLVAEATLGELFAREVRWARTIRSMRPFGYAGTIVTYPLLFALLNLLTLPYLAAGAAFLLASLAMRIALDLAAQSVLRLPGRARPWLVPFREVLSVAVWACGLFGSGARWRSRNLRVGGTGS